MVYEDMGIALDYTFDSAFEGQRSAFTEKARACAWVIRSFLWIKYIR